MRMAPGKLPLSKPTGFKRARTALLLACCATITAFIPAALGELPDDLRWTLACPTKSDDIRV